MARVRSSLPRPEFGHLRVNNASPATDGADNGRVGYSVIEYTAGPPKTDHGGGIGYTNGIDVHTGKNWVIRNNLIRGFHTPDTSGNL